MHTRMTTPSAYNKICQIHRWCHGSPVHRYGLYALQWIVEINGKPTSNLDAFVDVTKVWNYCAWKQLALARCSSIFFFLSFICMQSDVMSRVVLNTIKCVARVHAEHIWCALHYT